MTKQYILIDKKPVLCPNIIKWARFMEEKDRIVAQTNIGEILVSTVFLGLDHNFDPDGGTPILWETMVFGMKEGKRNMNEQEMNRCTGTWEQAEAMHEDMVARVEALMALEE